jgi:hypothetical protein
VRRALASRAAPLSVTLQNPQLETALTPCYTRSVALDTP